jgi:hypothetical protein
MPALIVWGRRDRVIPVSHAGVASRGMPGSRLEVFEQSGHFPQLDDPARFARLLTDFIDTTEGARLTAETLRERVLAGAAPPNSTTPKSRAKPKPRAKATPSAKANQRAKAGRRAKAKPRAKRTGAAASA